MWGSVVILRSQKGVGEQKRLGSTVVCNLPVHHTYKHCSKPQRRTHWYILRMSEQHERPLYAALPLQTLVLTCHTVSPCRKQHLYDMCSLPDRTRPGVLVTWILQHAGYCSTNIVWKMCPLKPTGHYMYRQFNIQQFHVQPIQCIYMFCVDLRKNSHYFPIQH
jgi:hypothetical protein